MLIFRSLGHPDFRRYFFGQAVSLIGFWLQSIAVGWLVYRLTDSAWMLGLVAFVNHIPMLFISPFAGLLADKVDRRSLVFASQVLQMLQAFVLAALTFGDWVTPWHVVVLAFLQGMAHAFDTPARHALLPTLIGGGKADLPNAIALNSLVMNVGRFLGPALAGVLLAWLGEAWCFLLNGISYLAVLYALTFLPSMPPAPALGGSSLRAQMLAGFAWVNECLPARMLMINLVVVSFTAPTYQALMPLFVQEVFQGDSRTLGWLVGSAGLGALGGTLLLASRQSMRGLALLINAASAAAGLGLLLFSLTSTVMVAMIALMPVGFGVIVTAAGTNTVLQRIVEDRLRARVVAIYLMGFIGTAPLGSLTLGALAERIGPSLAMSGFALLCCASAFWLWRRRALLGAELSTEYRRVGIDG